MDDLVQPATMREIRYVASPTFQRFHHSNAFFRGVRGPVGSGKTSGCVMEAFTRSCEQAPWRGVRHSRGALIRSTYPELLSTTLKTVASWMPAEICRIQRSPPITAFINLRLADGTKVESEWMFLALDSEEDVRKLQSLELTWAFINEASGIKKETLQMLTTRMNRYPNFSREGGPGPSWSGIFADTNPPDDRHWWYEFAEVIKPRGYEFYTQPPAMIKTHRTSPRTGMEEVVYEPNRGQVNGVPAAENVGNIPVGFRYYQDMMAGMDEEWIKVYVLGEYGTLRSGKPVYPEFSDSVHVSKVPLEPMRGLPLLVAFDFGLTPACVICQLSPRGQLRVLDEKTSEDMGIQRFARDIVMPFITQKYPGLPFTATGDPAGMQRAQTDEMSCWQILENEGFHLEPPPVANNNFPLRRESVSFFLTKMTDGEPGFLMSPTCKMLRAGFLGDYHYRKMKVVGETRYAETPDKNMSSHCHDALQYASAFFRVGYCASSEVFPGAVSGRRPVKVVGFGAWS